MYVQKTRDEQVLIRIENNANSRRFGVKLCIASVAIALLSLIFQFPPAPWNVVLFGVCLAVLMVGLILAKYMNCVEIDQNSRTFRYILGIPLLTSQIQGTLDASTINIDEKYKTNLFGEHDPLARLVLSYAEGNISLSSYLPKPEWEVRSRQLSDQLGIRINLGPVATPKQTNMKIGRGIQVTLWVSLLTLFSLLAYPMLTKRHDNSTNVNDLTPLFEMNLDYDTKQGIVAMDKQEYAKAERSFRMAIMQKHNISTAYNYLAYAFLYQKKYKEALECFNYVINFWPNNVDAHKNKGFALITLKKYPEALLCFEKILKLEPNNQIALDNKNDLNDFINNNQLLYHFVQLRAWN